MEHETSKNPNQQTVSLWRARPIFITSTFRDMHAERDHLRNVVFPELADRLRERRHNLEPIDLRWGVETAGEAEEHAKQLLVLKVCLKEVERSRPFLIGLLGDRYGWIPPQERIEAAAREAGFDKDVAGRSVTDLEIDFGVLSSPAQRQRSFFYFREPLPYKQMRPETAALYCDESNGLEGKLSAKKLDTLKARIEKELPDRVRRYRAEWDNAAERVTGLEAWGQQVLEDIWTELKSETEEFSQKGEISWQSAERFTLEQFVEQRGRGFIGREDMLAGLTAMALSPQQEEADWGCCITGTAGAGKSALYAALHLKLQQQDVLLLSHAAGISPRAGQVDSLLRRWIEELAEFLQVKDPIPEDASADDIDEIFRSLLNQASMQRRVLVLVDALNQFETTTRAEHLTWLPKIWPANARFFATAIPGPASAALTQRSGTSNQEITPLREPEASEMATAICKRYHRRLDEQVLAALLAKRQDNDIPACGNPLWLEIAVEELNLLDADAFESAGQRFSGNPEQQLKQLLMATVNEMPGKVKSLYGWMLNRAEKLHGKSWMRALVETIAISRSGWRESDFKALLPLISDEIWDHLKFAVLRRSFRAHVVQRGSQGQWDFAHHQMREAVFESYLEDATEVSHRHRTITDHLLALPADDPVHQSETMVHLIGSDDRTRAAAYYGGGRNEGELAGATQSLVEHILTTESEKDAGSGLVWVIDLLEQEQQVEENKLAYHQKRELCQRFQFELYDALEHNTRLGTRLLLMRAIEKTLLTLIQKSPGNADWQRDVSVSHNNLGDILQAQGDGPGAEQAYRAGLAIAETLAARDPGNAGWQRDVSVSHEKLGDILRAQGDGPGAEQAYRAGLAIFETLAARDPGNAGWQRDVSVSHEKLGDILRAQGDGPGAEQAYRASLTIRETLAARDPGNAGWQRDVSVSHEKLGDILQAQGDGPGAEQAYRASLTIRETLAARDPGNAGWQRDVSVSHEKLGDILQAQGDGPGAEQAYRASLTIRETLAARDPGNAGWQRDLYVSHSKLGGMLQAQGDGPGAELAYRAGLAIAETLAVRDPSNAVWQQDLNYFKMLMSID